MKQPDITAETAVKQADSYFLKREQLEEIHRFLSEARFASSRLDDALSDRDFSKALLNLGIMEDGIASADAILRKVQSSQEIKRHEEGIQKCI